MKLLLIILGLGFTILLANNTFIDNPTGIETTGKVLSALKTLYL